MVCFFYVNQTKSSSKQELSFIILFTYVLFLQYILSIVCNVPNKCLLNNRILSDWALTDESVNSNFYVWIFAKNIFFSLPGLSCALVNTHFNMIITLLQQIPIKFVNNSLFANFEIYTIKPEWFWF